MDSSKKKSASSSQSKENFDEDYQFKKRLPPTFPRRKNDVYANQKSPFIAQFNKCKSLLSNEEEIVVHGLGAAVSTAVNIALQLKTFFSDTVVLEPTTSTVYLVDDYIPITNKGNVRSDLRKNSAIHIKIKHVTS